MIEVGQGTPGSGKSAVAVARAISHLWKGGVVAMNFSLVDGWAEKVVQNKLIYKILLLLQYFLPGLAADYLYEKSSSLYSRLYRVDSLPAIRKIYPLTQAVGLYKSKGPDTFSEGEGLLLLDECQLVFNSRNCMSGSKNLDWIEFFTQHRKLHWNVCLIAHSIEMIDSQIRPLAEYSSTFRNLQKVVLPLVGIPIVPFPYFLVIKKYAGLGAGSGTVHSRAAFPLPLWAARLYDSLLVFAADAWGKDSMPHHCGAAPVAAVGSVHVPRPRVSALHGPHWSRSFMTRPGRSECPTLKLILEKIKCGHFNQGKIHANA